jgi:hypothetical protein
MKRPLKVEIRNPVPEELATPRGNFNGLSRMLRNAGFKYSGVRFRVSGKRKSKGKILNLKPEH